MAAVAVAAVTAGLWWLRSPVELGREAGLDVLLITVDTLRADALGAYGNRRAITPWMDRLSAAGVRFDNAHAHNVLTLPSHANILSGRLPVDHGVRDNSGFRFPSGVETLATLLKSRGYRTAAFVSAFPLDSQFGLDRGFDVYEDSFADAGPRPAMLVQERKGEETIALARAWLGSPADRPSFCWVHIFEPHFPYDPGEPLQSRFADSPYLGEVAAADHVLGLLLEPIFGAGRDGRTLVVLTSDHGEALGEHGEATHGIFAYEATLRVPLVFYAPRLWKPRVVAETARHVDILPTILEALGLPPADGLSGRNLLSPAAGDSELRDTTYFEALSGSLNRGWAPLHGIIRARTKFIELPIPELYDLENDPKETHNLMASEPRRVGEMRALLAAFLATGRPAGRAEETLETRARLKSLGYLSSTGDPSKTRYTEDDDPKRLVDVDAELQEVAGLYLGGNLSAALVRCRDLVRRRPGMVIALINLAHLERESGRLDAAIQALSRVQEINPGYSDARSLLGAYLTEAGRAREAIDLLEPGARSEQPDVQVLVSYSLALAKVGRHQDALSALRSALERDPSNALLLVDAGTVHLMAGERPQAKASFESALAANSKMARAHSSLAFMEAEDGDAQEALEHWKRACALDPREYGKVLALAAHLSGGGRQADARPYLEFFVRSAPSAMYATEIERTRAWLDRSH